MRTSCDETRWEEAEEWAVNTESVLGLRNSRTADWRMRRGRVMDTAQSPGLFGTSEAGSSNTAGPLTLTIYRVVSDFYTGYLLLLHCAESTSWPRLELRRLQTIRTVGCKIIDNQLMRDGGNTLREDESLSALTSAPMKGIKFSDWNFLSLKLCWKEASGVYSSVCCPDKP